MPVVPFLAVGSILSAPRVPSREAALSVLTLPTAAFIRGWEFGPLP